MSLPKYNIGTTVIDKTHYTVNSIPIEFDTSIDIYGSYYIPFDKFKLAVTEKLLKVATSYDTFFEQWELSSDTYVKSTYSDLTSKLLYLTKETEQEKTIRESKTKYFEDIKHVVTSSNLRELIKDNLDLARSIINEYEQL